MLRQFSRFPGILEVPGPEIRILRKISSPEPPRDHRLNRKTYEQIIFSGFSGVFPGNFREISQKFPGTFPEFS